jgi:hypothetical protein
LGYSTNVTNVFLGSDIKIVSISTIP